MSERLSTRTVSKDAVSDQPPQGYECKAPGGSAEKGAWGGWIQAWTGWLPR